MLETNKIMMIITFFVITLCQFNPEQMSNSYIDTDIYSCEKCPDEKCNNQTGECDDKEKNCRDDLYYGDYCNKSCNDSEYHCPFCNRTGEECYACEGNKTWGIHCDKTCERCPDHTCEFKDGKCSKDDTYCFDRSYYGDDCNSQCNNKTSKCLECYKENGTCTKCELSFFGSDCQSSCDFCPSNNCTMEGICTDQESDCLDSEKKGIKCDENCNEGGQAYEHCSKCKRNGTCTTCKDNKYWFDNCSLPCNDHCPDIEDFCDIKGSCQNNKSNCHNNLTYDDCFKSCNEIHPNCTTCDRNGICLSCFDNQWYGSTCEQSCEKCPDGHCDINGICIDQEKNCLNDSYFGPSCNETCSSINESCATCSRNETCLKCTSQAFFGKECNETCNCPNQECNIDGSCVQKNGTCFDPKLYGENCNKECNEDRPYCITCDRLGKCSECFNKTYYGYNCFNICDTCPGKECEIDGSCIDKDKDCEDPHFYKSNCSTPCNETNIHCDTCSRDGICKKCITDNFWGDYCNNTCEYCPDKRCYINGTCIDRTSNCINNTHYGERCNMTCDGLNPNCKFCNRDETCFECVNTSFYGKFCENTCDNCPLDELLGYCDINGTCYNTSGLCKNSSFTGDNCSVLCSELHDNCFTCNRKGICSGCINRTRFGDYCNESCANCPTNIHGNPDDLCNIDGICDNSTGLCKNSSLTGENCSVLCSDLYDNCFTCNRENICSECINKTKFGDYCNKSCENCPINFDDHPDDLCNIDGKCDNITGLCKNSSFSGENCSVECSDLHDNCFTCNREGICSECINRKRFGDYCNKSCENCPGNPGYCYNNGTCEDLTTVCDDDTMTGDNCTVPCSNIIPNCFRCNRSKICLECVNKTIYGPTCNSTCPNCPDGLCDISGKCVNISADCVDTLYTGDYCLTFCSEEIPNCERCHRNNTCFECSNKTLFGDRCENVCSNCPDNCTIDGTCTNQTELCKNDSFTGPKCDIECSSLYNNNCKKCNREKKCFECINRSYFGDKCEKDCLNCPSKDEPQEKCYNNGTCLDQDSLCVDDTKRGPGCVTECNEEVEKKFCKRCNRQGICTECTSPIYHGENCSSECRGCSENGCNIKGYCHEFKCNNDELFGLGCNENCTCRSNSDGASCGKFSGQCTNCKFGYFGKACNQTCNYKCQTELCCIFKEYENKNKTKLAIETYYKTIKIKVDGEEYTFQIDYNNGYPLTIFNNNTNLIGCGSNIAKINYINDILKANYHEQFTNINIDSFLYSDKYIIINDKNITTDLAVAVSVECLSEEDIEDGVSGIIGLGFFNSISNAFFSNQSLGDYNLNILSYYYNKENNNTELLFGDLFKEQIKYVEKLTSCRVELDNKTDIQGKKMTCKLDGIKASKYSEAFKLDNSYITFSLGENSSLILGNNTNYIDYLKLAFFDVEELNLVKDPKNEEINSILYSKSKINKLSDLGFVFNNFSYNYPPDKFFTNVSDSNDPEKNVQFSIKINMSTDRTEFVVGKEFFEDIKFTINNEEAQIYFYAPNAIYCDKFTDETTGSLFKIKLDARATSAVCLAIVIFIYLVAYTIYYFVKRKKMKSGDYIRIE